MLASAAAGSVLENWRRCSFPFLRNVLFLSFLLSGRDPLLDDSLCSDSNGPDEAQQFTSNCNGDLSLVLAGCCRSHVTLVQPVCAFHAISLVSSEILCCRLRRAVPDAWGTMIAPRSFDDDSSQMRIACFGDAPAPSPLHPIWARISLYWVFERICLFTNCEVLSYGLPAIMACLCHGHIRQLFQILGGSGVDIRRALTV